MSDHLVTSHRLRKTQLKMIHHVNRTLAWWLECSPMAWETWVQSQVESYQRLKKWYLMLPCLTLSIIRYRSRVKWSNPGKGVASSLTPWCCNYQKGSLRVTLDYGRQLIFLIVEISYIYIYIYIYVYIFLFNKYCSLANRMWVCFFLFC